MCEFGIATAEGKRSPEGKVGGLTETTPVPGVYWTIWLKYVDGELLYPPKIKALLSTLFQIAAVPYLFAGNVSGFVTTIPVPGVYSTILFNELPLSYPPKI